MLLFIIAELTADLFFARCRSCPAWTAWPAETYQLYTDDERASTV